MPRDNIDVILRLLNGRRFQSQMYAAGRSVRDFGTHMDDAARASSGLSQASSYASGSVAGIGAASRIAVLGLGALGAATVAMGVQFNATMEQNQLRFEQFAGGASGAARMTKELFDIAAKTPFAFTDITDAAGRMLAVGFDTEETNENLRILGDTLSYVGNENGAMERLVKVFTDVRSRGRLFQQEMNQLVNTGVNVDAFREKLGLTEEELANIGNAGVDANTALTALRDSLTEQYEGGAIKYMATLNGQWQRLKDNFSMASGMATEDSVFGPLKEALTGLNDSLEDPTFIKSFKDKFTSIANVFKTVGGFALAFGKDFIAALAPAAPFFNNILAPLFKGFAVGIAGSLIGLIGIIRIAAQVLGFIGTLAGKVPFLDKVLLGVGFAVSFFIGGILKLISKIPILGRYISVLGAPIRIFTGLIGNIGKGFGFVLVGMSNLLTKIPGFGVALGNAFLRLGVKVGNFLFQGMKSALVKVLGYAGALVAGVGDSIRKWLNEKTPFGDTVDLGLFSLKIPALADGGSIMRSGMALVGERGPEIVTLPRGASVYPSGSNPAPASTGPLRRAGSPRPGGVATTPGARGFDGVNVALTAPIYLDRRQIGEAMGEYVAGKKARR